MSAREILATTYIDGHNRPIGHLHAKAIEVALTAAGFSIVHKDEIHAPSVERKFKLGDCVTKVKGSMWTGFVVGFYSTDLTPVGYCVESDRELGSVQIYPEAALRELMKEVGR